MRAVSRTGTVETPSVFDQLAALFPRIAVGTVLVMAVCLTADLCLSNFVQPDLSTSIAELTQQWLFAAN